MEAVRNYGVYTICCSEGLWEHVRSRILSLGIPRCLFIKLPVYVLIKYIYMITSCAVYLAFFLQQVVVTVIGSVFTYILHTYSNKIITKKDRKMFYGTIFTAKICLTRRNKAAARHVVFLLSVTFLQDSSSYIHSTELRTASL